MTQDRGQALLDALYRAPRPLTGEELGSILQVSSRTVRNHVKALNSSEELVATSHHGYSLTDAGRRAAVSGGAAGGRGFDTRQRRLAYLTRLLPQSTEPLDVHELAAQCYVSESTLEGDLARAREVLREHDVTLRRDHDRVWAEGTERSRRRAVRQVLHQSGHEMSPDWDAVAEEFPCVDVAALRRGVADAVADSPVEMNEYALGDVVIHLVVTIDRIQAGHTIPPTEGSTTYRDPQVDALCQLLSSLSLDAAGVALPEPEVQSLYAAIAVRTVGRSVHQESDLVSREVLQMVEESMARVADHYLLGRPDASTLLKLAVHVENVVMRARSGVALAHPLGAAFRNSHPLVHEMALSFAEQLEQRLGIEVSNSEVDYLSLHMGMLYMTFLEQRDLPTITLVAPRYHGLEESLTSRLEDVLRGKAVVERTVTNLDRLDQLPTDMVVSCVPVPNAQAPVIVVSPLLGQDDVDRVIAAARAERDRIARSRMMTMLRTLIDPSLFVHVPHVSTKREALEVMCLRLEQQGYVDSGFLDDVLDRERRGATSFGAAFAIPHSMRMNARATGVSVLISDRGIPWGTSTVRVVLLFALSETGRQTFRDVLDEIIRVLGEPGVVEAVGGASSAEEFLAVMDDVIDR